MLLVRICAGGAGSTSVPTATKRFQQPAPSLLSVPRRERSLGTKPVFTQGVRAKAK
jgi:hypothetical protein